MRIKILLIFLLCFTAVSSFPVFAEDEPATLPPEYGDFLSEIPSDIAELLPDGLFESDLDSVYGASGEMTDFSYLLGALLEAVGLCMSDCIRLLILLLAIVFIGSIFNGTGDMLGASKSSLTFCVKLVMFSAIAGSAVGIVGEVTEYFNRLNVLTAATAPVMGVLYALGGNLTSAVISGEMMSIFLSVCQYVNSSTVVPVFSLLLAFALMSAVSGGLRLSVISDTVKRWYVSFLGIIMTVLSIAMGLQSALASKADGVTMKGLKYMISTSIPVVGGAISGSMSSLAAGVGLMRTTFGVTVTVILILMLLPLLVKLILYKHTFELAATVAELMGGGGEGKLLRDISGMYGFLLAAASISSVVLILAVTLLSNTAAAYG